MAFVPLNSGEAKPVPTKQPYKPMYNPGAPLPSLSPGQFPGVDPAMLQNASDLVNLQFGPQQNQLTRNIDQIGFNLDRDVNTQGIYGQKMDVHIDDIYNQLNTALQQGVTNTQNLYGKAVGDVGSGYDQAMEQITGAGGLVKGQLTGAAGMLGQEHALTNPLNNLAEQLAGLQAMNLTGKAGAVGNLQALGANMTGIAQQGVSDAAREGTQLRGDLARNVQDAITALQLGAQTDTTELLAQLSDLMGQRGIAGRSAVSGLQDQAYERKQGEKAQSFDEWYKRQGLDLDRQRLQADISGAGDSGDPLLGLKAEGLELDNLLKQGKLTGEGPAGMKEEYEGHKGLTTWMKDTNKPGKFKGAIRRWFDSLFADPMVTAINADPYKIARQQVASDAVGNKIQLYGPNLEATKDYVFNKDDVLAALDIYFKDYGKAK